MLLLGSRLIGTPIMSLQTGVKLASAKAALIDPSNLKIIAYEVEGSLLSQKPCFIRTADIRELNNIGMIVDSNDEIVGIGDVILIKKISELAFKLVGFDVVDEAGNKLGKVEDYTLETSNYVIKQLSVRQGIIKSFTDASLLIHRSQIIEINDSAIIVKTAAEKVEPKRRTNHLSYINPFRQTKPQVDAKLIEKI